MLLFITDRCPVGCAHCSVDSREDSATITDFTLFGEIVDWLGGKAALDVVGISGGEPFVERRGLTLASERLAAAGKRQVIFTSGVWAGAGRTPEWIDAVLRRCACVYLSTDAFHAPGVGDERFLRALESIGRAGAWIVVQVLNQRNERERAERLLEQAFGAAAARQAEVNVIAPLTNGRGATVFTRLAQYAGHSFGACPLVSSPMIRYDGRMTACCNEDVIMGRGPARLRRQVRNGAELREAEAAFGGDALLRVIGGAGLGVLGEHPRYADLARERYASNCEMCWRVLERAAGETRPDALMAAIAELEPARTV